MKFNIFQYYLMFKKTELFNCLLDYLYFHALMVFDLDAEKVYSKENRQFIFLYFCNFFKLFLASYPYFCNYQRIKESNAKIINNFSVMMQLPLDLTAAMQDASKFLRIMLRHKTSCDVRVLLN